jgi:hypothetical protein
MPVETPAAGGCNVTQNHAWTAFRAALILRAASAYQGSDWKLTARRFGLRASEMAAAFFAGLFLAGLVVARYRLVIEHLHHHRM